MSQRRRIKKEKGIALLLTLMILIALSTMSIAMLSIIQTSAKNTALSHLTVITYQAAEAGIEQARIDLIEEIVGEIDDELYEEDPDRIIIAESHIDVNARTNIKEISDIIGFSLYSDEIDEEINTIGGLVFILAGRVPQRGELVFHPLGFEIEIRDADARKIKKVRLRIKAHEKPQENLNEPQI